MGLLQTFCHSGKHAIIFKESRWITAWNNKVAKQQIIVYLVVLLPYVTARHPFETFHGSYDETRQSVLSDRSL